MQTRAKSIASVNEIFTSRSPRAQDSLIYVP